MLAAFCFVLDYGATMLNSVSGVFKLPLGALPIIIAAVQCGPLMGAAVGLTGTFLTQLITYPDNGAVDTACRHTRCLYGAFVYCV